MGCYLGVPRLIGSVRRLYLTETVIDSSDVPSLSIPRFGDRAGCVKSIEDTFDSLMLAAFEFLTRDRVD